MVRTFLSTHVATMAALLTKTPSTPVRMDRYSTQWNNENANELTETVINYGYQMSSRRFQVIVPLDFELKNNQRIIVTGAFVSSPKLRDLGPAEYLRFGRT